MDLSASYSICRVSLFPALCFMIFWHKYIQWLALSNKRLKTAVISQKKAVLILARARAHLQRTRRINSASHSLAHRMDVLSGNG